MQFGAACGLLVGHGVRAMVACIDGAEPVSLSLYAAVGAAAFLSGCVRYKSTAVLIAMESMGAWFLVVPIAVAGTPTATVPFAVAVGTWPSFSHQEMVSGRSHCSYRQAPLAAVPLTGATGT